MSETVSSVEPIEKEAVAAPATEETKTGDETVPPADKALPKEMEAEATEKPAETPVTGAEAIPLPEAVAEPPAAEPAAAPTTEEAKVAETPVEGEAAPKSTEDTKAAETETKPADIEVA